MKRLALILVTTLSVLFIIVNVSYAQDDGGDDGDVTLPTATATEIGGPTATPARTATTTPVVAEIVGDPTNLRSGPSIEFEIVAELSPGLSLPVTGRVLGLDWLRVEWQGAEAWVFLPLVIVQGDITVVEIVQPPPPPTENPAVADARATAAILTQTPGAVETATAQALFEPTGVLSATPDPNSAQGVAENAPTFTAPPPINQSDTIGVPQQNQSFGGIPPAALMIGMVTFGTLMIIVGVVRRFF